MKTPSIISALRPVVKAFEKLKISYYISKLEWFCMGGKVSDRQWNDVLGILKIQENNLDIKYLKRWSVELGLKDLLKKAFSDAGLKSSG